MATTFHINCTTDATLHAPPIVTCSGASFVYTGSDYWVTTASILNGATQYYISYTLSTSVAIRSGDLSSTNDVTYTGSQVAAPIGIGTNGQYLMYKPAAGGVTVSNVCITDTSGACEASAVNANFLAFM